MFYDLVSSKNYLQIPGSELMKIILDKGKYRFIILKINILTINKV